VAEETIVRAEEPLARRHGDEDVAARRDVARRFAQHGAIVGRVLQHIHEQREIHLRASRPGRLDARAPTGGQGRRRIGRVDAEEVLRRGVTRLFQEGEEEPEPAADIRYAASRRERTSDADSIEEEVKFGPVVPVFQGLIGSEVGAFDDIHERRRWAMRSRA
jgi:hypothetical protein